jgi:chromodomain-helicase-DNA-binding protein 4
MFSRDFSAITDDSREYVMCQGCSFMYHVDCLGQKSERISRGHNIIVLDEQEGQQTCVLQCGRCRGSGKNGGVTTRCFGCGEVGDRCGDFKHPDRVETTQLGIDDNAPFAEREGKLFRGWNDASKVLYRCMDCERACHFSHLPPPPADSGHMEDVVNSTESLANGESEKNQIVDSTMANAISNESAEGNNTVSNTKARGDPFEAYTSGLWRCNECRQYKDKKVEVILGWRPVESSTLPRDVPTDFIREYLIKFEDDSYGRALWVSATWLSGVTYVMKRNFDDKRMLQIKTAEDVIAEEWLRPDIIFDVRYENDASRERMKFRSQRSEMEALPQVSQALCKWQKLKYEECTSFRDSANSSDLGESAY